jgi:shikimate dehydrogenase
MISGRTTVYGILGWPVGHSLSPAMHNAAFEALGIDAAYVAFPTPPDTVEAALAGAHALGVAGLNVTVPHKAVAAQACEALDDVARLCGAANTLVRTERGWRGSNTDAPATAELLGRAGVKEGARALVLGAGGAARAALLALATLGVRVRVAARRSAAAAALCEELSAAVAGAAFEPAEWGDSEEESEAADLVVNATSVGLPGRAGSLPLLHLRAGQVACEFVYGATTFATEARRAGARLVSGEEILVRQGELAFQQWTGRAPPAGAMAGALAAASGALR